MKTKLIVIFISISILCICVLSVFAQVSAYVKFDKTTLSLSDTLSMQVVVNGNISSMPDLNLDSNAFGIISSSSSFSQSIVNGQSSSESIYSYILIPKKAGKFQIGKAVIIANGQKIVTDPTQITVLQSSSTVSTSSSSTSSSVSQNSSSYYSPSYAKSPSPVNVNPTNISSVDNNDIMFSAKVNKTTSYINEQLIYTTTIYLRQGLDQLNITPNLNDFVYEQQDQKQPYLATINGMEYKAYDFSYILFPTKTGHIIIPPTVLTGRLIDDNDPFSYIFSSSSYKDITLKTAPISIYVNNLPNPPSNFTNAVGRFNIKSEINKTSLNAGDTLTLTVTLWGSGNIKSLNDPKFALTNDFKKNFKIYPCASKEQLSYQNSNVYGQKVFKYDLVPLNPGEYTIPVINYIYFDPKQREYKNIKTSEERFKVFPGKLDTNLLLSHNGDNFSQITSPLDILPIHTIDNPLNQPIKSYYYIIFPVIAVLPYFLLFIIIKRINKKYNEIENTPYFRQKMAYKFAKRSIKELKKEKPFTDSLLSLLIKIFKQYLSDKLNISAYGLTANEIKVILQGKSIKDLVINDLDLILNSCEHMAYSKDRNSSISLNELYDKSLKILPKLDKELNKCL